MTIYYFLASRFYCKTSRAHYLLLNWIARYVDQAASVELWLTNDEYPESWQADIQVKVESPPTPRAISRALDVDMLNCTRAGEGSFSARIIDPLCPWNEGCWRFESCDGKLEISKTSKADCVLTIQGLTSLISGTHDPHDISLHGWGDLDPAIQLILCEMFPRMNPFMHESF